MTFDVLVVTYENPDLDGVACAIAYSELLEKQGKKAVFGLFGKAQEEVDFLYSFLKIEQPRSGESLINNAENIALMDASDIRGISKHINPSKVKTVIDHRKYYKKEDFPNANFEIEQVGAAASLISRKFFDNDINISTNSAVFLYHAIVSNTINFQAKVTTELDRIQASLLLDVIGPDNTQVNNMFEYKTQMLSFDTTSLRAGYSAFFEAGEYKYGIIQLEIFDPMSFILSNSESLKASMVEIQQSESLDFIFITHVDLNGGNNLFLTNCRKTSNLLAEILNSEILDECLVKRNGVIMRKEIVPIITEALEYDR